MPICIICYNVLIFLNRTKVNLNRATYEKMVSTSASINAEFEVKACDMLAELEFKFFSIYQRMISNPSILPYSGIYRFTDAGPGS